eukprot:2268654-Rhodomonas_salina.3
MAWRERSHEQREQTCSEEGEEQAKRLQDVGDEGRRYVVSEREEPVLAAEQRMSVPVITQRRWSMVVKEGDATLHRNSEIASKYTYPSTAETIVGTNTRHIVPKLKRVDSCWADAFHNCVTPSHSVGRGRSRKVPFLRLIMPFTRVFILRM